MIPRMVSEKTTRQKLWALGVLVLAVHLWVLFTSGAGIWRLQPESQKLAPLQTRVLPADILVAPVKTEIAPKVRAARTIPRQPPASQAPLIPAGMSAVASPTLPAPEAPEAKALAAPTAPDASTTSAPETANSVTEKSPELPSPTVLALPSTASESNALTVKMGDFPNNTQINYRLTGQERGLTYHAYGALKWQTKAGSTVPKAYEAELQVKAFLVGSRVWRSVGLLTENGLTPVRYSDSWRGERAAHFEEAAKKIIFSGNTPSADLQRGAQDQVSLFIQMAAAMTAQSFKIGSELNVQTATARDAVNWALTYKSDEYIVVNGDRLETQRWVCLPRGKFDSQIEMWLSKSLGGLPVRIKISQVNGNFIDMEMRGSETLPPLPS